MTKRWQNLSFYIGKNNYKCFCTEQNTTDLGFSEKFIPEHKAGIYDLMLGEYDMGGNTFFY